MIPDPPDMFAPVVEPTSPFPDNLTELIHFSLMQAAVAHGLDMYALRKSPLLPFLATMVEAASKYTHKRVRHIATKYARQVTPNGVFNGHQRKADIQLGLGAAIDALHQLTVEDPDWLPLSEDD